MLSPTEETLRVLGATSTLVDRIVGKIRFSDVPGGCDIWTGAYNIDGRKNGRRNRGRRPVIWLGGNSGPLVYVAPLLLALQNGGNMRPTRHGVRLYALHNCVDGMCGDGGWYRCVTLAHLRWGTQEENEADKARMYQLRMSIDGRSILEQLRALQVAEAIW